MSKVIATARGFHLGPREPGEVFDAPPGRDKEGRRTEVTRASWFEPHDAARKPPPLPPKAAKRNE